MQSTEGRQNHRVLVVEDDTLYRSVLVKLLQKAGFGAEGFARGADVLAAIETDQDAVLLLDQQLPDMSGADVISTLSFKGIKIPFIIMTGHGNERLAADMMKLGAIDYLVKDHDLQDILPEVVDRAFHTIKMERLLHAAEEALRENERRFRQLFAGVSSVAIRGFDATGKVVFWNPAAERLYGYSKSEAVGRSVFDLLFPDAIRTDWQNFVQEYVTSGVTIPMQEFTLHNKEGEALEIRSSHVLVRPHGRHPEIFALDVDLTGRKQAESEREALRKQLAQAQKMESVGRLAGGIAHDFNNLLSVIYGNCDLAMTVVDPGSEIAEYLQAIQSAAEQSADLTRQLLAYARKQVVSPQWIDLPAAIREVFAMLDRLIGENVSLVWSDAAVTGQVHVDPSQFEQIFTDLCMFAKGKMGVRGGKIRLTAEHMVLEQPLATPFEPVPAGSYALISLEASGPAVRIENLENLFDPFFGADPTHGIVDLGLATVFGMVRQNRGFINASSMPPEKIRFDLYLVFRKQEDEASPVVPAIEEAGKRHLRILVVEDDLAILKIVTMGLSRAGHTVLDASTPATALDLLSTHQQPIDLLITDVIMPGMNGCELAAKIRERYPDIRRIFVSGYTDDVMGTEGILDSGACFVQKPFSISQIRSAIESLFPAGG
jgi:two-component system, cell cycle sensor histidine kinase and response regulator CckA